MKILVTGGAGFIGSQLVDALCCQGADVLVIDSLDPEIYDAPPAYLNPKAKYYISDLRSLRDDARFHDVEAVVHLAALGGVGRAGRQRENVIGGNCLGTVRLLEIAATWRHLRNLVHCSSFSVYGSNYVYECSQCKAQRDGTRTMKDLEAGRYEVVCGLCGGTTNIVPINEQAIPNPLEGYGGSKLMQELCYRGFATAPVTTLRFSSVYGKRLRLDDGEATIIAKIAGWIRSGTRPKLLEDGRQIRDWVYVGDVVETISRILCGRPAPRLINVCSGVATTLQEACLQICSAMGKDCPPEIVGGFRPGDMRHCLGDPVTVRTILERDPTPFKRGALLAFGTIPD